jgi:hypothetical protein
MVILFEHESLHIAAQMLREKTDESHSRQVDLL